MITVTVIESFRHPESGKFILDRRTAIPLFDNIPCTNNRVNILAHSTRGPRHVMLGFQRQRQRRRPAFWRI